MGIDGNHLGYVETGLETVSPYLVKSNIMPGKVKPYTIEESPEVMIDDALGSSSSRKAWASSCRLVRNGLVITLNFPRNFKCHFFPQFSVLSLCCEPNQLAAFSTAHPIDMEQVDVVHRYHTAITEGKYFE